MKKHVGAFVTGLLGVALAYGIAGAVREYRAWAVVRDFVLPIYEQQRQQRAQAQQPQPAPTPQASASPGVKQ